MPESSDGEPSLLNGSNKPNHQYMIILHSSLPSSIKEILDHIIQMSFTPLQPEMEHETSFSATQSHFSQITNDLKWSYDNSSQEHFERIMDSRERLGWIRSNKTDTQMTGFESKISVKTYTSLPMLNGLLQSLFEKMEIHSIPTTERKNEHSSSNQPYVSLDLSIMIDSSKEKRTHQSLKPKNYKEVLGWIRHNKREGGASLS